MNRTTTIAISILIILATATSIQATQILYRSPEQLGQQSALVVQGRVTSVESWWNEKHTKVFTTTRVVVDNTYKGAEQSAVEIVQLGGVIDNIRVNVSGSLQWRPGEEVVLFLEPYEGKFAVSGFSQGKFNVKRDEKTGKAYIERPEMDGVQLLGAPSKDGSVMPTKLESMQLDDFINHALGSGSKGGAR